MKTQAWGPQRMLGAFLVITVMQGCSQSLEHRKTKEAAAAIGRLAALSAEEFERQKGCADQVVTRLARRDHLDSYLLSQRVLLEPKYRIRVFFQFRQDMRTVLPKLKRFWKFPRWLGGGRYASSYGHGQPGFELHLDPDDPSRTVDLDAHKSSDVDDHEPAGDFRSVALHAVNVVQHKFGVREKPPCDLLAHLPDPPVTVPAVAANQGGN
jgi:hypothetical protein